MEEDLFQNSDTNRGGYDFPYAQNLRVPGPFPLERGGELQDLNITFETYGTLNEAKDNAVLLCHALTGDSHVARHNKDDKEGWWDILVGPGKYVDTNRYFVICANNIGSCYGTTGPTSIDPKTGEPYGANFPVVTMEDNVEMQRLIMKHFGITQWLGIVGGSVGGMMSLIWIAGAFAAASAFLRISPISSSAAMTVETERPVLERISSMDERLKGSPTATVIALPILEIGTTWSLTHWSGGRRSKKEDGMEKCAREIGGRARYSAIASVIALAFTILFLTR